MIYEGDNLSLPSAKQTGAQKRGEIDKEVRRKPLKTHPCKD